ncbi:H-NS histone family protein [Roseomonas sp. KE2513]|uniref:H-NS histone family protein n=1 Tax=Roseomonas sp. KE2513 TaxID=2479202 RepID=UPI0018DFD728|nr:H-NS histone family protein [Roseomonas sp. KE2513]MBI0539073.1 H-NS histone family protein [Roseomonas sp. KE2513]
MAKSSIDLDNLSAEELTQLIQQAEAKRDEKQEGARAALIEEMTARAAALGMSLDALIGKQGAPRTNIRKVRGDTGKSIAAKFRSPDGETWSGRGRMPKWLTRATAEGKTKEDFAV